MDEINNLKLFEYSLSHPEPIIDDAYIKQGSLIISNDTTAPTDLMADNVELIESISTYAFAIKNHHPETADQAINKILELIKRKNINYSEFVSFWPVIDISFSLFSKMNTGDQLAILKQTTKKYIELRHALYLAHGYSPTTLQVGKDAKAHKESGNLGIYKIANILQQAGYKTANDDTPDEFLLEGSKKYIEADKKGKRLFQILLKNYGLTFSWSKAKEQKLPDFLIRHNHDIYIMEHKHVKEGGGGQDKQINEIISLIGFSEDDPQIHYVSFLDGLYFNLLVNEKHARHGKIFEQIASIRNNLSEHEQNYFVNTAGFKKLFGIE